MANNPQGIITEQGRQAILLLWMALRGCVPQKLLHSTVGSSGVRGDAEFFWEKPPNFKINLNCL